MPLAKKAGKHPAGRAQISGRRIKQPLLPTGQPPFLSTNLPARTILGSAASSKAVANNDTTGDREAIVPVTAASSVFPNTTTSKPIFKLLILGPDVSNDANSLGNPAMLDLLDLVRQRRAVRIDFAASFPNSITIHGPSSHSLRAAHGDICGFVHCFKLPGRNQLFMVQPSDDQHKKIILTKDPNYPDMSRPSFWEDPYTVKIVNADNDNISRHASAFRQHLARFATTLRAIPCNLHMQVHLGKLLVSAQDGENLVNAGGAASELHSALASSTIEDSAVFDRRIGSMAAFRAFQRQVSLLKGSFYPLSSVAEDVDDVQSQQFLVGVMESFRFELEIGPPGSAPDKHSAKLSGLRVFQTLGSEGKVGLTTACPNNKVDWKLETTPELKPEEIPAIIKEYLQCLTVVHSKDPSEFPFPVVRPSSNKEHRVKQLFGKTAWTVGCKGTQYMLELDLYHKFSKPHPGSTSQDQALTGISIWSSSWEEIFKPPTILGSSRDLGTDWNKLFQPGMGHGTGTDGVITFLKVLQQVSSIWDKVCDQMSPMTAVYTSAGGIQTPSYFKTSRSMPDTETDKQTGSMVDLFSYQTASGNVADVADSQIEADLISFD